LKNEALHTVKKEIKVLHTTKRRKSNWIGHILRRNCLLKHTVDEKREGGTEVKRRQGRKYKQLLNDIKQRRGY
jgi:hypothetical protein